MTQPPTFVHFDLPGDFHLAVNSNKKMKTVLVSASLVGDLDETVTGRAILPMILRRGTRSLPDMRAISRYLEDLYGTTLACFVQKIGEWHLVRFRLDVVNERFIPGERGVLCRALEFLRELLWEPLEVDGGFHPEFLEQEKSNLKLSIESLVDNKDAYAEQRLIEEMCRGEPYRFNEQGRIDDIPGIKPLPLREAHRRVVTGCPLHLYVAGDLDVLAARDLCVSVFSPGAAPRTGGCQVAGPPRPVPVGDVREVRERMDVNQARLHMGFRHPITYGNPHYEALLIMNGILGASGFSSSRLFQNVREKANLCYGIHSSLDRTKGLLFIESGIAAENYSRAVGIILEQIRALEAGEVQDAEVDVTRAMILNYNEMLEDNLGSLADVDLTWRLHALRFDFAEFRERVRAVRREHVVEAARSLRHDTTYLLAP